MIAINAERLLTTFLELVRIDSPSGKEAEVAAYCKQALEEAGCTVVIDGSAAVTGSNTGNLIASLEAFEQGEERREAKQAAPLGPLYFSAHMDTIEPCRGIKPHIKEGIIYSDGTTVLGGDDKVGVAAIIEMIRCVAEGETRGESHPEIRVLLTVQEEVGLIGAKALDRAQFSDAQGALCYVLDAGGTPGLVVNGAPYQLSYRAHYRGTAAHAGMAPETGISAIRAAAQAVAALPQGQIGTEQTTATTNIGIISGGTATNVVAAECTLAGELRCQSKEQLEGYRAEIDSILKQAPQDDGTGAGLPTVTVEWEVNYEGFYAAEDSPQVVCALKAAEQLGLKARVETANGGADTNILASYGLAAVSLGSGMTQVHSTEEHLALADLENLTRLALGIVNAR